MRDRFSKQLLTRLEGAYTISVGPNSRIWAIPTDDERAATSLRRWEAARPSDKTRIRKIELAGTGTATEVLTF